MIVVIAIVVITIFFPVPLTTFAVAPMMLITALSVQLETVHKAGLYQALVY